MYKCMCPVIPCLKSMIDDDCVHTFARMRPFNINIFLCYSDLGYKTNSYYKYIYILYYSNTEDTQFYCLQIVILFIPWNDNSKYLLHAYIVTILNVPGNPISIASIVIYGFSPCWQTLLPTVRTDPFKIHLRCPRHGDTRTAPNLAAWWKDRRRGERMRQAEMVQFFT